jgi:LPS-assembly protein
VDARGSEKPRTKIERPPAPSPHAPVYVTADELRALRGGESEFTGHVEATRADARLTAAHLLYDSATTRAEADGAVTYTQEPGDRFETSRLNLKMDTREGETAEATFVLGGGLGRGDAQRVEFAGHDRTVLHDVRFTTCASGQDSWFLGAKELELDTATDIGTARHTTVEFQGVPIFYFPYLSFPISDERKSGFLMPMFGYNDKQGVVLETPYYLNLAPNYDATLSPRLMATRGLMLGSEFRYLGRATDGQVAIDYLPNDRDTGEDRAAGSYVHHQRLSPEWTANVDVRAASDKEYFSDFGDDLNIRSRTHLPQTADLNYSDPLWAFNARLAGYQTVDPAIPPEARPYQRLPQLTLAARPAARTNELRPHFEAEAVYFTRDVGITGSRLNLNPALSLPLAAPYGFLTPKIGAHHIAYNLSDAADDTPSVTRPVYSLDSGLYFERDTGGGGLQTFEPRLFYLYVPPKNQDALPNFDTGLPDFSFASLFRENRFSGGDRIGDANQLTVAVTSRFFEEATGSQWLRLSLGEIHYFADREVNLPPGIATQGTSDLAAEAVAWLPGNWHASGTVQWNQHTEEVEKSGLYVQYQPTARRILNLGHRYLRDQFDAADVSTEWPLAAHWTLRARSLYSLKDKRNVESYAGLEYDACCWAVRVFAERHFSEERGQVNSVQLELELTGLSSLGGAPKSPLKQSLFSFPEPTR